MEREKKVLSESTSMSKSKSTSTSTSTPTTILSDDLSQHYANHGVIGLETFITQASDSQTKAATVVVGATSLNEQSSSIRSCDHGSDHGHDNVSRSGGGGGSRFIRLNPRYDKNETLNLLTNELTPHNANNSNNININNNNHNVKPIPIPWISSKLAFYAIPNSFSLVKSKCFQEGRIYGMDVSSGAAIAALMLNDHDTHVNTNMNTNTNINNVDHLAKQQPNIDKGRLSSFRVLDLCCAPGLKTCAIADLLSCASSHPPLHLDSDISSDIRVVGIDISEQRMQLCKNIIKKYHIEKATCGASTGANVNVNVNVNVITGADSGNSNDHIPLVDNEKTKSIVGVKSSMDTIEIKNKLNMNMIMNTKPRIRLYCTDGTTFGLQKIDPSSLFFDSDIALEEEEQKGKRKRMNKSARARQKKKLRKLAIDEEEERQNGQEQQVQQMQQQCCLSKPTSVATTTSLEHDKQVALTVSLFDRVLVDAECSTDGAVRHLQHKHKKCNQALVGGAVNSTGDSDAGFSDSGDNGPQKEDTDTKFEYTHNSKLTDINKLAELVDLQKRLLQSGFRLLKPGGVLVYSTCSLATEQNEKVVSWLLNLHNKEAFIIPVSFQKDSSPTTKKSEESGISSDSNSMMIYEGSLEGTVRFHPNVIVNEEKIDGSGVDHNLFGGGFFLAKIGKKLD